MQGIPAHLEHMAQAPAAAAQPPPAAAPAEPAAPAQAQAADPAQPAQPAQPQNLFQLAQQRQQQGQQPGTGGGLPGLGAGGAGNLGSLAEHPQLQHLRNVMAQNPQLAQPIIQELAAQGRLHTDDLVAVNQSMWALLHGLTALRIGNPSYPFSKNLFELALDAMLRGTASS